MSFSRALLLALLLHALLLAAGARLTSPESLPGDKLSSLRASLRPTATPEIAPQPTAQEATQKKGVRKRVVSHAALPAQSAPASDRVPEIVAAEQISADGERDPVAPTPELHVAEKTGGGSAPDVLSADGLRQYRVALAREARRYRRYPPLARVRGWQGVVEIQVRVRADGPPTWGLARTSGYDVLDEQALEMMGRAILAAAIPESLRRRTFSLPVPVRFSLDD